MRRSVFAVLALALILPLAAQAQEWTAEQQEVWDAAEACWTNRDLEAVMGCIHEDFVAWGDSNLIPRNKTDYRASNSRGRDVYERVWRYAKPLSVVVRGNVAIVLKVVWNVRRNKVTGEETSSTMNWTEIYLRDGGRWLLLSEHGTPVRAN